MSPDRSTSALVNLVMAGVCATVFADQARTTAAVSGTVVDAHSKQPVAGVVVVLEADRGGSARATTTTGPDGRYAFKGLLAGQYRLRASKAGGSSGSWGQRTPTESFQPLELRAGELTSDANIRLWRGAIVSGFVRDEQDEPVSGVGVVALQRRVGPNGPHFVLSTVRREVTDDRGQYRLTNVPPGVYVVAIVSEDVSLSFAKPSASAPTYPTVFYPGAPSPGSAQELFLDAGQEAGSIDFRLSQQPARNVLGVVRGVPDGMALDLRLARVPDGIATDVDSRSTEVDRDGRFSFGSVPYGQYILRLTAFPVGGNFLSNGHAQMLMVVPGEPAIRRLPDQPTHWGEMQISVDEHGPAPVELRSIVAGRISGQVIFDGSSSRPSETELRSTPVMTVPVDRRSIMGLPTGRVEADGQFETAGVPPGKYAIWPGRIPGGLSGWYLRAVRVAGVLSPSGFISTDGSAFRGVELTMTDRQSELAGTVRRRSGEPDSGATVVVFSTDRAHWYEFTTFPPGLPVRVRDARPNRLGQFRVSGVPAGEYFVTAVDSYLPSDWKDSAFLSRLVPHAARVTLEESAPITREIQSVTIR